MAVLFAVVLVMLLGVGVWQVSRKPGRKQGAGHGAGKGVIHAASARGGQKTQRPGSRKEAGRAAPDRPGRSGFGATSIKAARQGQGVMCQAAAHLQGQRFLDADGATPMLPLPDCDLAQCECRYAHHADRRDTSEERRLPNNLQAKLYEAGEGDERRERASGRRRSDLA